MSNQHLNKETGLNYFHKGEGRDIEQCLIEFFERFIRKDYDKFVKAKQFSRDVFQEMGRINILGAMIPEEYGGVGLNMSQYVILMESLACYGGGEAALALIAHHSLAAAHIIYAGTEEQKMVFLPKLASGEMIGAWCLTEPGAGSDAFGGMRTTATPTASGWLINGTKQFITNALHADIYVVMARIKNDSDTYGAFIIPRYSKGLISSERSGNKIGMHANDTMTVTFDSVEIGAEAMMAEDGRVSTFKVLNNSRIGISALACGLLRSSLFEAINRSKERMAFGKPIANNQGVTFPLVDAYSEWLASWAMVKESALAADNGTLSPELSAATKLKTTRSAFTGCLAAMDTFAGEGYHNECRAAQDFLSARLLQVGEGTDNMQRLIIARALFR
ncbi:MAG: acyl-CoA dehydrogenase family protein [Candidatus Omnitrophota bacterium]|nr:acyl-CoA dehydrogenase family protein [Candidatus Omnitrophota bacterium]